MIPVLIMMLLALVSPSIEMSTLDESEPVQTTSGRQGSLDVDCSGYTFEDLFEYDFALFTLDVNDDWATGVMDAKAWVNGSKSAVVRDNLDGLFEGVPGGDDDWISTDERETFAPSDQSVSPTWKPDSVSARACTPRKRGLERP